MRAPRSCVAALACLGVLWALATAPGAAAATEVGNRCLGTEERLDLTGVLIKNAPGSPLAATVPSAGIITRWSLTVEGISPGTASQMLKVFRPTGLTFQFGVVGESALAPIVNGTNSFLTRIPVQAGDHVGSGGVRTSTGATMTVLCLPNFPGNQLGMIVGNPPNGTTTMLALTTQDYLTPVVVTVESDADKDGFGDETQDRCPRLAALQVACPVIVIDAPAKIGKKSAVVRVGASEEAPVSVIGTVKLGKGRKVTLEAEPRIVAPGPLTRFKLSFPSVLKQRLNELKPKQKLTLTISASATAGASQESTDTLTVKLKGQARPAVRR